MSRVIAKSSLLSRLSIADANTLAEQLSEIYGAEVASASGGSTAAQRRARSRRRTTNTSSAAAATGGEQRRGPDRAHPPPMSARIRCSSFRRASSSQTFAGLCASLTSKFRGEGRIQVYYLRHADAEELSETLNSLVGTGGGGLKPKLQPPRFRFK